MIDNEKKNQTPANDTDDSEVAAGPASEETGRARDAGASDAGGEAGAGAATGAEYGAEGGDEGGGSEDLSPDQARIRELEDELASLRDNAMRAMAEAENTRKRAERQIAEANKYGTSGLARDMLTIGDYLRQALVAVPADQAGDNELLGNLRAGVEMTENELHATLERHGVTEISPRPGERFDPNFHQAMFEIETDEHPPGTVAQIIRGGYKMHERLLRAAMVGVAKAPKTDDGSAGADEKADGGE